ncbi:unnamed protein product [[Candida] boidinii]|nr:unnamed protein product [[Candida] boidinii]
MVVWTREVSLTQTDDDGSVVPEDEVELAADGEPAVLDETAADDEAAVLDEAAALGEAAALEEAAALDKRDETTELGILVETSPDNEAETEADDETAAEEEDGHGAQAVPVGSLGKPHSDNGASRNFP